MVEETVLRSKLLEKDMPTRWNRSKQEHRSAFIFFQDISRGDFFCSSLQSVMPMMAVKKSDFRAQEKIDNRPKTYWKMYREALHSSLILCDLVEISLVARRLPFWSFSPLSCGIWPITPLTDELHRLGSSYNESIVSKLTPNCAKLAPSHSK